MTDLQYARRVRINALSGCFDDPLKDEMEAIDEAIAGVIRTVARRCAEIVQDGYYECVDDIVTAIRREFSLEEGR